MNPTLKIATFLSLITLAVFFISNEFFGGYLSFSHNKLADEIGAPPKALYEWNLSEETPYKYRMLFSSIVKGSWHVVASDQHDNEAFLLTYQCWSLFFLITAVLSFFILMQACGFDHRWSFAGSLLFLISPPILLAYTLPVHTREDTLGYTLLCLGLLCMLRNRIFLFLLIAVLGVFCRETLLILPFVFLFFTRYKNFFLRTVIAAIPVGLWLALRLLIPGGNYDPWEGLKWNISNMAQVAGFSFITFNFMWVLFFLGLTGKKDLSKKSPASPVVFLYRSGLAVFLLIVITTFLGGIFNEIRLLFLLFPWVITLSLHVLYRNRDHLFSMLQSRKYIFYLILNVLVFGLAGILLVQHDQFFLEPSKFDIPYHIWIVATMFYILTTVLFLPAYLKVINYHKTFVSEYANHC